MYWKYIEHEHCWGKKPNMPNSVTTRSYRKELSPGMMPILMFEDTGVVRGGGGGLERETYLQV